jgi:hypothetical protein
MKKPILESDEQEYDAKLEVGEKKEGVIKAEAAKYKEMISGIEDTKLLDYIAHCAHTKASMLHAEERLTEKGSDESGQSIMPY